MWSMYNVSKWKWLIFLFPYFNTQYGILLPCLKLSLIAKWIKLELNWIWNKLKQGITWKCLFIHQSIFCFHGQMKVANQSYFWLINSNAHYTIWVSVDLHTVNWFKRNNYCWLLFKTKLLLLCSTEFQTVLSPGWRESPWWNTLCRMGWSPHWNGRLCYTGGNW